MKHLKLFNERFSPSQYLTDNKLFKYIIPQNLPINEYEMFENNERPKCEEIIKNWIIKYTDHKKIGIINKTPYILEFQLGSSYILFFRKLYDDYYLIRAILKINGNRVPMCVIIDSIEGVEAWGKSSPFDYIEEWGSLKESVELFDWGEKISHSEWLKRHREKLEFDPKERLEITKVTRGLNTVVEFDSQYNSRYAYLYTWKSRNGIAQKFKLARIVKSTDEWYLVDIAGQNWIDFKCDALDGLKWMIRRISELWNEHKSLHKLTNILDPSTKVDESITNSGNDFFFKEIRESEYRNYIYSHIKSDLNNIEISSINQILKDWKILNIYNEELGKYEKKIGPKTFKLIIRKFEDEWFTVYYYSSEPQPWKNRKTGQTILTETIVDENWIICDQIDGLTSYLKTIS
jgi:hypothetical protein